MRRISKLKKKLLVLFAMVIVVTAVGSLFIDNNKDQVQAIEKDTGNFTDAVRPTDALITKTVDMSGFNGKTVYMGFTSAVGSFMANNTIHSFALINDYMQDDIKTSYTEEYYIENPKATTNVVEFDGRKYELQDSYTHKVNNVKIGETVEVTNLSYLFNDYNLLDSQTQINAGYPRTATVETEGKTVVYQFYNLKEYNYNVEYYKEVSETDKDSDSIYNAGSGKWYKLVQGETVTKSAKKGIAIKVAVNSIGAGVTADTVGVDGTFKTFPEYTYNDAVTKLNGKSYGEVTSSGITIQLFFDKNLPTTAGYKANYYLELEDQTSNDYDLTCIYSGKTVKFKLDSVKSYEGDNVEIGSKVNINDESDYYNGKGYDLMPPTTEYPSEIEAVADKDSNIVYQIYILKPKYTVKYYTEVPEGTPEAIKLNVQGTDKYYKLENVKFEKIVENETWITGKQLPDTGKAGVCEVDSVNDVIEGSDKGFSGYEFSIQASAANGKFNIVVERGSENLIELFYNKLPKYTVEYYVEVKETEKYDVSVDVYGDVKYYIAKTEETYEREALTDTKVEYAVDANEKAGVKEKGNNVDVTFKSFDGFNFSDIYTEFNGRYKGKVSGTNGLVIQLFYNKKLTSYKEKYYIEVVTMCDDGSEFDTIGDKTYKVITNIVPYVPIDTRAVITDKSNEYKGYKLLEPTADKPWIVEDIDDNEGTIVYQVYDLPSYTVKYYKEVFENKAGTIEVDGKYYELQSDDTFTNKATLGTKVDYIKLNDDTAGVKEGASKLNNTYKSYDYYEFSEESTAIRGNDSLTISETDENNVIELFFDTVPTKYTMKYLIEVDGEDIEPGDEIITIGNTKYKVNEKKEVTNLPLNADAEIEDKKDSEPYVNYELQPSTDQHPSKVTDIADDGTTVVYQIYRLNPKYTIKYYTEVPAGTAGAVKVGDKYFVEKETVSNRVPTGTDVIYVGKTDKISAGVKEDGTEKANTIKSYPTFIFSADITESRGNDEIKDITFDGDNLIELFFVKNTTKYTEQYLVEIEEQTSDEYDEIIDGIKYKVAEENVKTDVPVDSKAEIDDKSDEEPYNKYELMDSTTKYPQKVEDIDDAGKTVVYQIYRLYPKYVVKYYTEVAEGTIGAVKVGDKWYILKVDETITNVGTTGTKVIYVSTDDKTAGVKEGNKNVTDTLKNFEGFTFANDSTNTNGMTSGTLAYGTPVVIELFYDKVIVEYKEKYWTEKPDATENFVIIVINGVEKKFVLNETTENLNVKPGTSVEVADKSQDEDYSNYELVEVEIPNYPTSGVVIGSQLIVHQIYVLKPTYEVQYYLEVRTETPDSIEVNGRYYVIVSEETLTKYASTDTLVSVATNVNGAGVKEATKEIADTFKKFSGYEFSQNATDKNGLNGGDVKADGTLVVMLMYNLVEEPTTEPPTTEPPTTEPPITEPPTTEPPTTEPPTTEPPTTEPPTTEPPTTELPTTEPPVPPATSDGNGTSAILTLMIMLVCAGAAVMYGANKRKAMN